jgi:tripeptide aminopeptidase
MFNQLYHFSVADRLMRYVQVDTQSDPGSASFPSTEKQKDLGRLLVKELKALGLAHAEMDEYGYVYATLEANHGKQRPVVCFCSHMDTAPDCSGSGVVPILHKNYDGSPIVLPHDTRQVIDTDKYPYLKQKIGDDIITASGLTLLGGDDKAGVAIIMDMVQYLVQHPEVEHGTIKILFTPDEEVGRGTEHVSLEKLGADFGFTLDGGEAGDLEDETFSADGAVVTFNGVISHPGYAKGKMVNALKVAAAFLHALPADSWCPEATEGREGFVHPVAVSGGTERAEVEFILRSFNTTDLAVFAKRLEAIAQEVADSFPGASYSLLVREQYRNMKEVLDKHPEVMHKAEAAIAAAGLRLRKVPIRGGTDGSRLSFMGLPCPNLFTGMQAIHSRHEWICVQDMQKAVEVLVRLVQLV